MKGNIGLYIVLGIIVLIILIFVIIHLIKTERHKNYKKILDKLEYDKNIIASTPISLELSKVEALNKNDELDKKCEEFNDRLNILKNEMIPHIDDMLIELDTFYDKKDYDTCNIKIAEVSFEIYRVREHANRLLNDITEITSSDEKYRSMIIKLKTRYRKINNDFQKHKNLYEEVSDPISMQLESCEKRFMDFEKAMDSNIYSDALHIIKALTTMIDQLTLVIKDVPDLILMCRQILPSKIKDVRETYDVMVNDGYVLNYLNIPYNMDEALKNTNNVYDKIKVLNLEYCKIDVDTILKYLDSLFVEFEKERLNRSIFEEEYNDFSLKLSKTNKAIEGVISSLDSIKNTYDLNNHDIDLIKDENKAMTIINDDFNKLKLKLENKSSSYSDLHTEIESLSVRLKNITERLDDTLKNLGTMYDDEQRAREQLEEIERFLKSSKNLIHSYKLPVISDKYFVELNEANEAISEVIKELSNKPIVIKTLNTRVDTARDLVLKLYNTTSNIIKDARFTEDLIVYLNRYNDIGNNNLVLEDATKLFYKGIYHKALDTLFNLVRKLDKNMYLYVMDLYNKN